MLEHLYFFPLNLVFKKDNLSVVNFIGLQISNWEKYVMKN